MNFNEFVQMLNTVNQQNKDAKMVLKAAKRVLDNFELFYTDEGDRVSVPAEIFNELYKAIHGVNMNE